MMMVMMMMMMMMIACSTGQIEIISALCDPFLYATKGITKAHVFGVPVLATAFVSSRIKELSLFTETQKIVHFI
jgi:hypothetical protein